MRKKSLLITIILAWLVAGTLDISGASVILGRGDFKGTLQYIAGAVSSVKPQSGISTWLLGAAVHYGIALSWTILYFILYKKTILSKWPMPVTALLYGILIFFCMRYVFVPMFSTLPPPKPYTNTMLMTFIKNILILSVAFGITLKGFAAWHFRTGN